MKRGKRGKALQGGGESGARLFSEEAKAGQGISGRRRKRGKVFRGISGWRRKRGKAFQGGGESGARYFGKEAKAGQGSSGDPISETKYMGHSLPIK